MDFLLDGTVAIEVKAVRLIQEKHTRGLRALMEAGSVQRAIIVCRGPRPRTHDGIEILPWEFFLMRLWSDEIVARP